ncbi:MAG TPA: DUF885 domain-containing protein [Steroidobacteraceae bacterium]|nr:DUF885 domain-containing protein [Steroidobacteraceae bacterium]
MARALPPTHVAQLLCALTLAAVPAAAHPPAAQPVPVRHVADARFAVVEHEYVVYILEQFPVVATYLGGVAFDPQLANVDGRLRDYSPEALQAEDAHLAEFRARFAALAPARLSAPRRIDRSVALAEIAFLLHQHQVRRHQQRALDSYVDEPVRGVDWQIQGMSATGAATYGTEAEWQAVTARTRAVPAYLAIAEKQLTAGIGARNTPDWRLLSEFGLQSSAADADYFSSTLPQIAVGDISSANRDALLRDLQAAGNEAAAAYRHLREFVARSFFEDAGTDDATPLPRSPYRADHFAFGEAEYDWALRNNLRVTETAAGLFAASWPIVQATRAQLVALAQQIAASHKWPADADGAGTVRQVFAQLGQNAPRTDAEMVEGYAKTAQRLVAYARSTGLFAVPADYRLDVTLTPPPLRASIAGAAYYAAPPFKKAGVGRFYITPTGDDPAQLRQEHNYASMADLTAHEGFPGHDWHYKVMTQYREQIAPVRWLTPGAVEDSSSMWQDSMAAEGWALYAEGLPAEPQPAAPQGCYSPEERLYELRGKLYRDLRVRIDTGIHTGRLSFEDAVTMFSEVVDFLPGSCRDREALKLEAKQASCRAARAAITRYARWPTQAITYRLGKEQILSLRRRAQQALGTRFVAQRFHLEFMKQGPIPPGYFGDELLRALRAAPP